MRSCNGPDQASKPVNQGRPCLLVTVRRVADERSQLHAAKCNERPVGSLGVTGTRKFRPQMYQEAKFALCISRTVGSSA